MGRVVVPIAGGVVGFLILAGVVIILASLGSTGDRRRRSVRSGHSWGDILRATAARRRDERQRREDAGVLWSVHRDVEPDGRISIGVHRKSPDGRVLQGPLHVEYYDPDDLNGQLTSEAAALSRVQFFNRISEEKRS
jgi:hypothetical protein